MEHAPRTSRAWAGNYTFKKTHIYIHTGTVCSLKPATHSPPENKQQLLARGARQHNTVSATLTCVSSVRISSIQVGAIFGRAQRKPFQQNTTNQNARPQRAIPAVQRWQAIILKLPAALDKALHSRKTGVTSSSTHIRFLPFSPPGETAPPHTPSIRTLRRPL